MSDKEWLCTHEATDAMLRIYRTSATENIDKYIGLALPSVINGMEILRKQLLMSVHIVNHAFNK